MSGRPAVSAPPAGARWLPLATAADDPALLLPVGVRGRGETATGDSTPAWSTASASSWTTDPRSWSSSGDATPTPALGRRHAGTRGRSPGAPSRVSRNRFAVMSSRTETGSSGPVLRGDESTDPGGDVPAVSVVHHGRSGS